MIWEATRVAYSFIDNKIASLRIENEFIKNRNMPIRSIRFSADLINICNEPLLIELEILRGLMADNLNNIRDSDDNVICSSEGNWKERTNAH